MKGFVRWESGVPAQKAEVYIQHAGNFRRYLQRAETDANGYFKCAGVPGGEPYIAFAVPRGEATLSDSSIGSSPLSVSARFGGS